jgi:predicted outer membrane protein
MNKLLLAAALSLASFSVTAQMRDAIEVPSGALAPADVEFLRTADSANIDQLTFAMRVTGRSKTAVRSLAENVLRSHRKADDALRLLAAAKHVDLDHRMTSRASSEADELLRRDVPVDRIYAENVVRDGNDLISLYENTRDNSPDPDIRKFADDMLPALRSNTRQAQDMLVKAGIATRD